jgi:CHASE2 domain-containing sensor protein
LSGAAVACVLAGGLWGGVFSAFRLQASDALFPTGAPDSRIVVVGIDDRAVADTGLRWPWPREVQARLVNALAKAGALVIVLDVVYNPATDSDRLLGEAMAGAANVVIASAAEIAGRPKENGRLLRATAIVDPVPVIAASAAVGESSVTPDTIDGVVRSVPLAIEAPDARIIPALSLVVVARVEHIPGRVTLRPRGVQLGDVYVPTGAQARLRIAFASGRQEESKSVVSATDVLSGRIDPGRLAGKIVIVGATAPGLGDTHRSPVDKGGRTPGVFIQAAALDTMLSGRYLSPAGQAETLLWVVGLATCVAVITTRRRIWLAVVVASGTAAGYILLGFIRFDAGVEMDLVYPPLAVALAFGAGLAGRLVLDARERRRMGRLLEQYVPATIARDLLDRDRRAGLPTGTITFLFTDVVGSTEAWDQYPQAMSRAMRRHDALVEEAIHAGGGAVVGARGEGDSRFCVFLRPGDAANAALAIDRAFTGEQWPTPTPLRLRTGLHTGEAELREGDYYGSPVNRCARIRSVAEPGEILVSEATRRLIEQAFPAGAFSDRGVHVLKGLAEPEHVFALRSVPAGTRRDDRRAGGR